MRLGFPLLSPEDVLGEATGSRAHVRKVQRLVLVYWKIIPDVLVDVEYVSIHLYIIKSNQTLHTYIIFESNLKYT